MMTTRTWSLCSDLDGVGTAMITSRVMSVPSSAHPRRVANPSRSPRQADFADPLGRALGRSAVAGGGGCEPVSRHDDPAGLAGPVEVVAGKHPPPVLAGQGGHDVHVVVGVADRNPSAPRGRRPGVPARSGPG